MRTFLKTHWLTITICLVYSLIASGVAGYFVYSSAQANKVSSLKMAEELKTAKLSLENANMEVSKIKAARDKEKTINTDLKRAMATSEKEIESLRNSLESSTQALLKIPKPKTAQPQARPVKVQTNCRESNSDTSKEQLSALRNLQADIYRQESELRERQKKLDDDMNKLATERDKMMQQKSEYRWPHAAPVNKKTGE